ncbi:MAG: BON domain-containing protein [Pseudomonadota bacterium]
MRKAIAMALAAACSTVAIAQGKSSGNAAFDALDKNADGYVSRQELAGEKELAKRFVPFDADRDGRWNVNEYLKANQDRDGRVLSDSAITARVKAKLLAEKGVPSTAISVETYEGRVLLSGFVDSADVRAKAGRAAAEIAGVRKVHNHLEVK